MLLIWSWRLWERSTHIIRWPYSMRPSLYYVYARNRVSTNRFFLWKIESKLRCLLAVNHVSRCVWKIQMNLAGFRISCRVLMSWLFLVSCYIKVQSSCSWDLQGCFYVDCLNCLGFWHVSMTCNRSFSVIR